VIRFIARTFLRLTGWKPVGTRPAARSYVLMSAPHTSNWDLAFMLAIATELDVKVSFMAKSQLFAWPMGTLMRKVGGIPVFRDRRTNMVDQMAERLRTTGDLALAVPAEGTRGYVPHWKSGFYHIALKAGVPIVFGYLDYAHKQGGFGPEMIPTGNVSEDMDVIRDFYSDIHGKFPEHFGEIRLKEEM
jgi:1-acyl-sn-glycerol-3-phosphate acyltransferase